MEPGGYCHQHCRRPSNEADIPTYDLDGNLRFDGGVNKDNQARQYVWDAENRLIEVLDC